MTDAVSLFAITEHSFPGDLPDTGMPASTTPASVVDTARASGESAPTESASASPVFAGLGLEPALTKALQRLAIHEPTPVQAAAIPVLLQGRDLIGSAPTGTGKTAAFMLPALQKLARDRSRPGRGPRVLVLTPTRELAQQVARAAQGFSRFLQRMTTVCITGGESYFVQNRALSAPYEILVATPGRLMDQMRSGKVKLDRVEVLVLDEADRMLDMGFAEDVTSIADATPAERQTVCFTATVTRDIRALADRLLRDPHWLTIDRAPTTEAVIDDHVLYVDGPEHRLKLLEACLRSEGLGQAIVFTGTRRHTEELADHLGRQGFGVEALHGDMGQRERMRALNRLRRGDCKVLVATDVAARGIDVASITHVINYSPPRMAEDYIHRIGRTGRAGASGQALTFVGADDIVTFNRIEHFLRRHVQVSEFEGLEARFRPVRRKPRPKMKSDMAPGGRRRSHQAAQPGTRTTPRPGSGPARSGADHAGSGRPGSGRPGSSRPGAGRSGSGRPAPRTPRR